jgi:endonuclease G
MKKLFVRLVSFALIAFAVNVSSAQSLSSLMNTAMHSANATSSNSSTALCERHFFNGSKPSITKFVKDTTMLCFENYAVLHSGITKTPIFSAEFLTRESIKRGASVNRSDDFHPEQGVPSSHRAELSDYKRSGFDRGHMSPDKDAPWSMDLDSLANMVPQAPDLNRGDWAELEKDVRRLAKLRGSVYVLTGPAFADESPRFIGRGVQVPSHVWKIVVDPKNNSVQAFVAKNRNDGRVEVTTVAEIERVTGIHFNVASK